MSMGQGQPPGWYHAESDPPATHRYWDGAQWVGGPQPTGPMPGLYPPGAYAMPGNPVVAGGRVLADPGIRIVARLIDGVILTPIAIVIVLAGGFDNGNRLGLQLVFGLVALVYEVGFIALKGATVGKMVMGIAVSTTSGTVPPGWGPAAVRWVVTAIPCVGIVVFIVSVVFLFSDNMHRTVNDRAANTLVVKTR